MTPQSCPPTAQTASLSWRHGTWHAPWETSMPWTQSSWNHFHPPSQSGNRPRTKTRSRTIPPSQSWIRPRPPSESLGHKRPPGPCPTSQGQTSPGACQTPQTLHLELTNSSLAILCAGPPVCALPPRGAHQAAHTCMSKSICNMHVGVCKMHVGICYMHVGFCNMHVGICKMHVGIGYMHVGFCNMLVDICNLSTCLSPHGR